MFYSAAMLWPNGWSWCFPSAMLCYEINILVFQNTGWCKKKQAGDCEFKTLPYILQGSVVATCLIASLSDIDIFIGT